MKEIILLLVSDPLIRKVIREALEASGYCVLPAADIAQAADLLKECTPDLLMIRHYVQNVPGYDAALYLRKLCPGIPVLIVGGVLDDYSLESRAGIHKFEVFPKPYKAGELIDKVKEVLAKRSFHVEG
jgi:DNA-binding response OmpR family regulator